MARRIDGLTHDPSEERSLPWATGLLARDYSQIERSTISPYRIVGFVEEAGGDVGATSLPVLGTASDLLNVVSQYDVDRIVVSLTDRRGQLPSQELLQAKMSGVRVEDAATTYERLTGKILTDGLKPSWLIFSEGFCASRATRVIKRMLDLFLSAVGLVIAGPLMLLTALAVWLDSPGPVLYCQDRVGEGGRLFTLCKFRSMRMTPSVERQCGPKTRTTG
jgi:hypothetical protein